MKNSQRRKQLLIELVNVYNDIENCKGVQSQQLWARVGEIKQELRGII